MVTFYRYPFFDTVNTLHHAPSGITCQAPAHTISPDCVRVYVKHVLSTLTSTPGHHDKHHVQYSNVKLKAIYLTQSEHLATEQTRDGTV